MRQLTVFILFVLSFSLAQSLTGNYVFTDPDSGQSITLGLEQAQNNTFVGQLGFLGTSLELTGQVTGPGTGTGEFTPVNDEMTALGKVLIALQGDQLSLTFEDTGDELTLTREGATPLPADNSGDGEDTLRIQSASAAGAAVGGRRHGDRQAAGTAGDRAAAGDSLRR